VRLINRVSGLAGPASQPSAAQLLGRTIARIVSERIRGALPVALALVIGSAWPVFGQFVPASGQLTVRSDGFIFWLQDGQRHLVYPTALSDEQINAWPEGVPLNASLMPLGPATETPAEPQPSVPTGTSRADRLLLGQTCQCFLVRGTGERSDLLITVAGVTRDAWRILQTTNPGNQLPRQGFEYVMVMVNLQYVGGPGDLPISLDRFDFSVQDSAGTLHVPAFVIEPQALVSTTVFPGSSITGAVAFQVPRADPDPVLIWRYSDENPVWFAIQ
jgi:uncharacterized protein DUF4352